MIASLAKAAIVLATVIVTTVTPALADTTFTVKRAIGMDQWVDWPSPDEWGDPDIINNFPQWQSFVGDDELAHLKKAGFDTVRLPLDPAMFLIDMDPARIGRLLNSTDRAIDRLRAAGLNVIVDMHTIPRGDDTPAAGREQIVDQPELFHDFLIVLGTIADRLNRRSPEHVALEVFNEPGLDCGDETENQRWHDIMKQLHAEARRYNPDVTLVLSGACGGSGYGLVATDPSVIPDDNVIWSFHHYKPFKLTHQSARWAGPWGEYLSNIPYPPSSMTDAQTEALIEEHRIRIADQAPKDMAARLFRGTSYDIERLRKPEELAQEMEGPFKDAAEWADRHGVARDRIFMGEFGMLGQEWERPPATTREWRVAYIRDMVALAEDNGFSWSVWSFGGAFGLMQGFSGERLDPPLIDAILAPETN